MKTRSILHGLTTGLALLALPAAAFAADGFARSSGTLRAGAGSDYPAVMRVAAGTELDVIGCLSRYTWCDVDVDGERGWFPGSRIGFLRDGRRVYLSDGGSALGLTILSFGMADYWGNHYSGRPWYNERRWWRGHGQRPPHLTPPPRPGGPGPIPPRIGGPGKPPPQVAPPPRVEGPGPMPRQVGTPGPRTKPIGQAKPRDRVGDPPTARPAPRAPQGAVRTAPPRGSGGADRLPHPQTQPRGAPQGGGQQQLQPYGR